MKTLTSTYVNIEGQISYSDNKVAKAVAFIESPALTARIKGINEGEAAFPSPDELFGFAEPNPERDAFMQPIIDAGIAESAARGTITYNTTNNNLTSDCASYDRGTVTVTLNEV